MTFELEQAFERVYALLDAAAHREGVSPLDVRDAVKDLEAAVEEALSAES